MDIVTQCPLSGSYSPFCPLYYSRVACVRHVLHGNVNVQKQKKVGEGRISIDYHSPLLLCFFWREKEEKRIRFTLAAALFSVIRSPLAAVFGFEWCENRALSSRPSTLTDTPRPKICAAL